ncbi:hypothetical protein, partial [Aphanothece microscopica]|uniref:hypothetical protein n=1 Tax=Aphanothece microscopica TaxID=1049561 RepID=UPI0039851788
FINGFSMCDNVFRTVNTNIDRIEGVDATQAGLDFARFRNIVVEANTFNGITQITQSPVTVEHAQNTASNTWVINAAAFLPFGSRARNVQSIVAEGAITTAGGAAVGEMPWVQVEQGAGGTLAHLRWSQALRGQVKVTLRCDNPN